MISAEQIRGARAILDISRESFALKCGAHPNTIYNLEKNKSVRSAGKIQAALEKIGFEFIGTRGVNLRDDGSVTFTGPDSCDKFYNYVLATVKETGGNIFALYPTVAMLARSLGVLNPTKDDRIETLTRFGAIKCLLSNASHSELVLSFVQLRAISQNPYSYWSILIFGNKFAHVMSERGEKFFFYVSNTIEVVQEETNKFHGLWDKAIPLR